MAEATEDYLSMTKQTRIDLSLSLVIHRSNAGAHIFKTIWGLKKSKEPERELADQTAIMQFELDKDTNPFFRKHINGKLRGKQRIADHINALTYVMLWDILSETQPTIKDLTEKGNNPNSFVIDKREARRLINVYYDFMHTHPTKWSPEWEKLADDPRYVVFSFGGPRLTRPLPKTERGQPRAVGTPLAGKKPFNSEIRVEDYADPYYLERLFSYKETVLRMLATIATKTTEAKTGIRKEFRWVIDELVHNDYALTVLFQNAAREVEKRWFDESLSPNSKIRIIYRFGGAYTRQEIAHAISLYKSLCADQGRNDYQQFKPSLEKMKANVLEQITLAAIDFANRGETYISWWLFTDLLASGFKLKGKDKATIEHNIAIFEMLHGEPSAAAVHFESALRYWTSEQIAVPQEIDRWNFAVAHDKTSKDISFVKQKHRLIDLLARGQSFDGLRLFLIRQFADVSDLFKDKFALERWLKRGLQESEEIEGYSDLALYFEARLGSFGILGSTNEERKTVLSKADAMRDNYCKILGDTENFIVVVNKKFYLLTEEFMKEPPQEQLT